MQPAKKTVSIDSRVDRNSQADSEADQILDIGNICLQRRNVLPLFTIDKGYKVVMIGKDLEGGVECFQGYRFGEKDERGISGEIMFGTAIKNMLHFREAFSDRLIGIEHNKEYGWFVSQYPVELTPEVVSSYFR